MLRGRDVSKYVVIDSDEIKKSFPEYQGWNAQDFQTEADDVIQKLVAKAVAERKNLIIDGTLKSLDKYSKLIDTFKGVGYRVGVLFADLPIDKAIERALARFQRSGRFVDPAYIATHDRHNFNTFNALKPKLDFYEHYDTNVSRGEKPRLVERK
jgi:predicted ABC-type ATPase